MSCFSTVSAVNANSVTDLTKHVNYTAGMILGVDDFTQEFAYLAGRDRWLARDALGFGTVSGLSVKIEEDKDDGFRVMVNAGVAISPRGQLICVPSAQCAFLDQWLAAADKIELDKHITRLATSPPTSPLVEDELTLYIVLCYRDCPDDRVPIPGEPCRSEDELTAPSRIKDDFSLELRYDAPRHAEEKAVRDYVEWLKQITVTDSGASSPVEDLIKAVRDEWLEPSSPPVTNPPPASLQINADDFCEYMRVAFRLWVTELRNVLSERKTGCAVEMTGGNEIDDCVLIAQLNIPLEKFSNGIKVGKSKEIELVENNRPFLLHLRMLQEWMLCGCHCRAESGTVITSPSPITSPDISLPHNHFLDDLSDVNAALPSEGQHLVFRGGEWIAEDQSDGTVSSPPAPIALDDLSDVTVAAPANGQVLTFRNNEWVAENVTTAPPVAVALDDLSDVTVAAPTEGQILIFRNNEWVAEDPAIVPPVSLALDNLTDVAAPSPTEGQRLVFRGGQWIAETAAAIRHNDLTELTDDDHPQYLLTNGSRALTGNLQGGNRRIINLAAATANGEAVIFQQAVKNGDGAGGDLTGTYPNPTLAALQGRELQANAPNQGDMLVFNGTAWITQPQNPPPTANVGLILPLATVTRIENLSYEIWFNIDAPGNVARVSGFTEANLQIFDETEAATTFTERIRFRLVAGVRNVFTAQLVLGANQPEPDRMRFNFDLTRIVVQPNQNSPNETMPLIEYAQRANIRFTGFLEGRIATVFVRGSGIRNG